MTERIAITGNRPAPPNYWASMPPAQESTHYRYKPKAKPAPAAGQNTPTSAEVRSVVGSAPVAIPLACLPPKPTPKPVDAPTVKPRYKTPTRTTLSKRQQGILDFIRQTVALKGFPPSIREIGEAVNLCSSSTVHSHLRALEDKGFIKRDPSKPRSIELLDVSGHRIVRLVGSSAQCESLLTTLTEMAAVLSEDGATGEAVDSLCLFRDQLAEQLQRGAR